jgi:hypothetical protein
MLSNCLPGEMKVPMRRGGLTGLIGMRSQACLQSGKSQHVLLFKGSQRRKQTGARYINDSNGQRHSCCLEQLLPETETSRLLRKHQPQRYRENSAFSCGAESRIRYFEGWLIKKGLLCSVLEWFSCADVADDTDCGL